MNSVILQMHVLKYTQIPKSCKKSSTEQQTDKYGEIDDDN